MDQVIQEMKEDRKRSKSLKQNYQNRNVDDEQINFEMESEEEKKEGVEAIQSMLNLGTGDAIRRVEDSEVPSDVNELESSE